MSEVRTAAGALRGTREDGVAVFRGIPFAEAPVGALRFAAPRPARGWDGVRTAVSYGPPPRQPDAFGRDELSRSAAGNDWLTVNVWSPDPGPDVKLPVMVWIHGGAYTIGMSSSPEYDGRRLARDGVVMVTFNYDEQAAAALRVFAPGPDGERRYREAFPDAGPDELYELVHSDWLFRMPTLHLAQAQTAGGGRVHVYELAWPAPGMGGVFGACHGLDVPLVFGNLDRGQPAMLIGENPSPEAETLSAEMRTAWTSFATHGDPGWPVYDAGKRLTQIFDTHPVVAAYPEENSRLIWQDHTFPVMPLIDR